MRKVRLNRRAVLRGAGSVAIALPWLECMAPERTAQAASAPATRFVTLFTPGGTVLDNWLPSGTETEFTLSTILQPLSGVMEHVLIPTGIDMKSAAGEQNQCGIIAWLTGTAQRNDPLHPFPDFAKGPSLDQVLASRLSAGLPLQSLQMAVRWGTGRSYGVPHPINIANFADTPTFDPIPPQLDPVLVWNQLFGAPQVEPPELAWKKSILDAVGQRYQTLMQRVGAQDRLRLEAHFAKIREMEQVLAQVTACSPPELVDTSDYDPAAGLLSTDTGSYRDLQTDAAIPKVGKLMMDMLVTALACDITRVASFQWSDTEAKHTFPWLGLNEHLHYYMNDGGYRPAELTTIFTWYSQQHAYFIEQLAQVTTSTGPLLNDTIVFFGSQLQNPADHTRNDMPFLLAGNGGGLRTGRVVNFNHPSHNDLLVSLLNLCGDDRQTFGTPEYCTGPLGGLT